MKSEKVYKSEAEMCAAFIEWAEPQGWTSYPECCGWDILLVQKSDGAQFGIQAKMHFNATLLRQVMPSPHTESGPDYRGVVLPRRHHDIETVLAGIGVCGFYPRQHGVAGRFIPSIDNAISEDFSSRYFNPVDREKLPDYVPDVAAGINSPVVLTTWKIAALKVCAVLELEGSVTSKRIRQIGIDPRRWTNPASGWLTPVHMKPGHYVRGPRLRFDQQHPKVYVQIKAEMQASGGDPP